MRKKILLLFALLSISCVYAYDYEPYYPFKNLSYVVYKAPAPVEIDGNIYTEDWEKTPWTEDFQDIRGDRHPEKPNYRTRAKVLWDNKYIYFAVELEEPNIWATITGRDEVIFWDNDIEFFIDPTCFGSEYREFEFNAFNMLWELLLTRPPYRGGISYNDWDAKGLKSAVKYYGTINDPSDKDEKWTIEVAIPLKSLSYVYPGTQWRMNFSRVEWQEIEVVDGKYKKKDGTNTFGHENNWLWSPTGAVDAHRPERWGWLQFSGITVGQGTEEFNWNNGHEYREALWVASNRIKQYRLINGTMPKTLDDLGLVNPMGIKYQMISDGIFYLSVDTNLGVNFSLTNEGVMKYRIIKGAAEPESLRWLGNLHYLFQQYPKGTTEDTIRMLKFMY